VRKSVSAFVMLLILSVVFASFPQIGVVKAEGTIYIRADGTVEGTDKIQREGNVYTFTDNINGEIVVEMDGIVVDGADYTLYGNGSGIGIELNSRTNVTIKNVEVRAFGEGIYLLDSQNNHLIENYIADNGEGMYLHSSRNTRIIGNNLTNNWAGIYPWGSSNDNTITGNDIKNSTYGIYLFYSTNNNINLNNIRDNTVGIYFVASNNTIYNNNFINNSKNVYDEDLSNPSWFLNPSINIWNNGSEGNYWSDYNGTDINGDGIGDTPYIIDENNKDNYPLMELYTIPENPPLLPLPYAPFNLFPEPDSIDIPLDTNISISISRPPSIVNISMSPEVAVKERIDEVIDYNGRYTFILSELLEPNTIYSVTMDFGDEGAPEGFAPTSTKTWNFTTVAEAGTDFPIIEATLAVSVIVVVFVVLYYSRRKLKL
jgi:parallel beta-helix repeat protein